MNKSAIQHRATAEFTYAVNNEEVVVTLKTGKDVQKAFIIWEDPFINELRRKPEWYGKKEEMQFWLELEEHFLWRIRLTLPYKRLKYYFTVIADGQEYSVFEDRITETEKENERSKQHFKFPWLNPSDVIMPPDWVSNTVWYQIMPEQYSRSRDFVNPGKFKEWGDLTNPHPRDLYGGSLKGITERLPYIQSLGIGGIYLTPIFLSDSNHKYNIFDYRMVDPDFGTEDDLRELIRTAHSCGIKIMLDAVFNHCGHLFPLWLDVRENKKKSRYYDWFFINKEDFTREDYSTEDGRFYSFSFWAGMPKLNTNNPEVIRYFTDICTYWLREWDIDGIRFDVADEVSHTFLRALYDELKTVKPSVYLLGEIWTDSALWVNRREFDAVMNYPFSSCINDFWKYQHMTVTDFAFSLNRCLSMYPQQSVEAMFNFLDTHDTARAIESCENEDVLLQKIAALITMPGTPCIYYGTELPMHGLYPPYNRQCMPWDDIEAGKYADMIGKVSDLLRLRKAYPAMSSSEVKIFRDRAHPRFLCYEKDGKIRVCLNAGKQPVPTALTGKILYANLYSDGVLDGNGILIEQLAP